MKRTFFVVLAFPLSVVPGSSVASGPYTAIHPEAHLPDPTERASTDQFTDYIGQVQQKLREQGFDAGPVNGDFGFKTQAALAQFQLSLNLPASGQLDDGTLDALGLQRPGGESASAGASAAPDSDATADEAAASRQ